MSLRTFTDSTGQEWDAFDVVPRSEERRHYDRRSAKAAKNRGDDDRRTEDRRLTVGGAEHIASKAGWLCFQRADERRRLSPIPDDWIRCDEATLEAYCREAKPASVAVGRRR